MLLSSSRSSASAIIGLLCGVILVAGCSSNPPSRYQQAHDSEPGYRQGVGAVPDAVPKVEARSRGGNKSPYRVLGKQYWVMQSSLGYAATGTASWYGSKFHGHQTSNGEIYNMYSMTAAHKSLPIPTYLKVTNLDNGRDVIVRVNDRGPFHGDRIIDLSYAAATKLGYASRGTARVRIEAIDPVAWQRSRYAPGPVIQQSQVQPQIQAQQQAPQTLQPEKTAPVEVVAATKPQSVAAAAGDNLYVQVGAFASFDSAQRLKQRLQDMTDQQVVVYLDQQRTPNLHKVQVGPLNDMSLAQQMREMISNRGLGSALILALPQL